MKITLIIFIALSLSLVWGATGRANQKLFDEEILNISKKKRSLPRKSIRNCPINLNRKSKA